MAKIAIDIDNTLYDFEGAARQAYLDLAKEKGDFSLFRGAYNPWGEWRSMSDICGDDACAEVIARVHSPKVIQMQTPYEQSYDVLDELVNDGHILVYISNRGADAAPATAEWLWDQWSFPLGQLICTMENKIPLLWDCQYIIDDRPKTQVQFVYDFKWQLGQGLIDGSRLAFGLAFPFNQALTDIPGIYLAPTWGGIHYYLKEKGVLYDERNVSTR